MRPRPHWWLSKWSKRAVAGCFRGIWGRRRLERLLEELDRWVRESGADVLEAPEDVKRYRRACIDQIRAQLTR